MQLSKAAATVKKQTTICTAALIISAGMGQYIVTHFPVKAAFQRCATPACRGSNAAPKLLPLFAFR